MAQTLLWHGLAQTTRKGYATGRRSYERFCVAVGIRDAFPASESALCAWLGDMLARNLAASTAKAYLHGLDSAHRDLGLQSIIPSNRRVLACVRGFKRVRGLASTTPPRLPITFATTRRLCAALQGSDHDALMLRAALWTGTAGLLRVGEFGIDNPKSPDPNKLLTMRSLSIAPSAVFGRTIAELSLLASKTDPFRKGVKIPIVAPEAIEALSSFLAARRSAGAVPPNAPLFAWSNGTPLSREQLTSLTIRLVNTARIPWVNAEGTACTGVSFRKGGANSLLSVQTPDRVIQTVGRWRSHAYTRYLHESPHEYILYFDRLSRSP
jgi:hypothetical protein